MIYGAFLGGLLAFNAVPALAAIPLIVGLVISQGLWGVVFQRSWISGERSDYGDYVERLKQAGLVERAPWVMYLLQSASVCGGFGVVVYAACVRRRCPGGCAPFCCTSSSECCVRCVT